MISRILGSILVALLLATPTVVAAKWAPPEVEEKGWDWIRLNSGEWLGGTITRLRDLDLEFDSDELDDLTIDLKDVAEIRSPRILTWGFEGGSLRDGQVQATGTATMRDGVIRIRREDGEILEFEKAHVVSIIEGRPRELNYWSMKASWNLTGRSGNTNQTDYTAYALVRRETTRGRIDLEYRGNFGKLEDTVTTNNQRGRADWNAILRRGFFLTPFTGELFGDEFQNIELRVTAGVGFGLYLVRNSRTDLWISLNGGYQVTQFISVTEGDDERQKNTSVTPAIALETEITKSLDLDASYDVQIGVPDPENSFHNAKILFSLDAFGDILDFTASLEWNRNENPQENAEGETPEKDDFITGFGLGIDF